MQFTRAQEYSIRHIILNTQAKLWPVYHQQGCTVQAHRNLTEPGERTEGKQLPSMHLTDLLQT